MNSVDGRDCKYSADSVLSPSRLLNTAHWAQPEPTKKAHIGLYTGACKKCPSALHLCNYIVYAQRTACLSGLDKPQLTMLRLKAQVTRPARANCSSAFELPDFTLRLSPFLAVISSPLSSSSRSFSHLSISESNLHTLEIAYQACGLLTAGAGQDPLYS